MGSTVLVFSAFGEVVLTSRLAQRQRPALARTIDVFGQWIYLAAVAAGAFGFLFI